MKGAGEQMCPAPKVYGQQGLCPEDSKKLWQQVLRIQAFRAAATGKWKPGLKLEQAVRAWPEDAFAGLGMGQGSARTQEVGEAPACQQAALVSQAAAPSSGAAGARRPFLAPYAGHWKVQIGVSCFCLKCGGEPGRTPGLQRLWAAAPCVGEQILSRKFVAALFSLPADQAKSWPAAWQQRHQMVREAALFFGPSL